MMAARFEKDPYARAIIHLIIGNYGPSIARNVRVTFDPPLPTDETAPDGQPSMIPVLIERYREPIDALVPNVELRNAYWIGTPSANTFENTQGTSDRMTVTISYEGDDGAPYSDPFTLDTKIVRMGSYVESSNSPDALRKKAVQELEKTATAVRTLAANIAPQDGSEAARTADATPGTPPRGPSGNGAAVTRPAAASPRITSAMNPRRPRSTLLSTTKVICDPARSKRPGSTADCRDDGHAHRGAMGRPLHRGNARRRVRTSARRLVG